MKTTSVPLWLLAATLIAAPTLTAADSKKSTDAPPPINDSSPEAMLKRYDTNKDGKIDDTEKAAALKERRGMSEYGDESSARAKRKKLKQEGSQKEPEMAKDTVAPKDPAAAKDMDTIKEIDRAEAAAMRKRDPNARRAALIKRFDVDGDGELNLEEKAAVGEFLLKQMEKK